MGAATRVCFERANLWSGALVLTQLRLRLDSESGSGPSSVVIRVFSTATTDIRVKVDGDLGRKHRQRYLSARMSADFLSASLM